MAPWPRESPRSAVPLIGRAPAMEAILTGEPIPAPRAYELGLVSRLTDDGGAFAEAERLADQITACAPLAVWESRAIVNAASTRSDDDLIEMSNRAIAKVMRSEDTREGLAAFVEKRPPNWTGR